MASDVSIFLNVPDFVVKIIYVLSKFIENSFYLIVCFVFEILVLYCLKINQFEWFFNIPNLKFSFKNSQK
jgi:hypothetical protein